MAINFPAEWQDQDAIVLNFPHSATDWADNLLEAENTFLSLAKIISSEQTLVLLFVNKELQTRVLQEFNQQQLANIKSFVVDSNDTWARDFFAISTIKDGKNLLLDFKFNAWGNKFEWQKDNQINKNLAQQGAFTAELKSIDLVLEGGALESDGTGTLLTSHFNNLHLKRNPDKSEAEIRKILQDELGAERILSLEVGWLEGDDTDGHIDTLARFINENTIVFSSCQDSQDSHFAVLNEMRKQLETFTTLQGEKYKLLEMPIPKAIYNQAGERLAASYVNFIILRNSVILPIYGDQIADACAQQILEKAMPNHKIHTLDAREIIKQGGSFHCLSMQIPKGFLA